MKKSLIFTSLALLAFSASAFSYDASLVPEKKHTTLNLYMSAAEAYNAKIVADRTGAHVILIDVRTPEELSYVGVATEVDANIPFKLNVPPSPESFNENSGSFMLATNDKFADMVSSYVEKRHMSKTDTIILMCRSGDRSAAAANVLTKAGFTKVYSVYEGFEGDMGPQSKKRDVNGWKNRGLPWSYKLSAGQVAPLIGASLISRN